MPVPSPSSSLLSADAYSAFAGVASDHRSRYGPEADQFLDLYLPAAAPPHGGHPTVALIHGGCWREQYGLEPLGQMARALTERGFAVASLEYRRVGGAGGWPQTFLDAAAGLEHLAALAAARDLDLHRLIACGHSAGGHLALWLAGRAALPPASEVAGAACSVRPGAVVSLAGIGDLRLALERGVCGDGAAALMGADPETAPERYSEGSPAERLPLRVPHWHVVGAEDALVPSDYVAAFAQAAAAAGDETTFIEVPDAGHFEIVHAESAGFGTVARSLEAALARIDQSAAGC